MAKNHWILPTHSNVTSKVGLTLPGPPCTYFTPGRVRSIVMSVSHSEMSVYLSVRSHISKTTRPNFTVRVDSGRGSDLLWRRCDTLCTSGFADDVVFSHSGLWRVRCIPKRRLNTNLTAEIPTKFGSTIQTENYSQWVADQVCYLRFPCLICRSKSRDNFKYSLHI